MTEPLSLIDRRIADSIRTKEQIGPELKQALIATADRILEAHRRRNRILVAGNGGSACDAQHMGMELVGRFYRDREPIDVLPLTGDGALLTALANDLEPDRLFSRQVEARGRAGDVLLAISTSGRSPNVLVALETARRIGLHTVGLTGQSGGSMAPLCDILLRAPSNETPRIQECHVLLIHLICEIVEAAI